MKNLFITLGIMFTLIAIIFLIAYVRGAFSCSRIWSSFQNRYGPFSGCQIYVGNKWIPASSYYFKQQ